MLKYNKEFLKTNHIYCKLYKLFVFIEYNDGKYL